MNKFILFLALGTLSFSQAQTFTKQDTLRGSITPEREWWDLNYYHLDIAVDPDEKYISGSNTIRYKVLKSHQVLQVDLQPPLSIEKVTQDGKELTVTHNVNAHLCQSHLNGNAWCTLLIGNVLKTLSKDTVVTNL